ncbi:hypothetical protein Q2T52_05075 [Rhizobium oryzicola]|uniref:Uncharacterized protein n=1 Tax=Rhizobium oryzicola TaxID=1232668 RepID=A0ABT8STT4_9HYPH|nr:hypothetical protein [Rhizobium oryzicola]MDO1581463.1 hypothetical protein [Rhizobium oryzicola]
MIVAACERRRRDADLGEFEHAGEIKREIGGERGLVGGCAEELADFRALAGREGIGSGVKTF